MNANRKDTIVLKIALIPAFILATLLGTLSLLAISIGSAVADDMSKIAPQIDIVDTELTARDFDKLSNRFSGRLGE